MLKRSTATGFMPRQQRALEIPRDRAGRSWSSRRIAFSGNGWLDRFLDDHLCLDGVVDRNAEDVIVGILRRLELLGDNRARGPPM